MKYNKNWEDMSEYLVHFSSGPDKDSAYSSMMGILFNRNIKAVNPFGFAKRFAYDKESQKSVCFSEAPLHLLERISKRRGPYGIGFKKRFISNKGGNPILYAIDGTPLHAGLEKLLKIAQEDKGELGDTFWEIAPFIDRVISNESSRYQFDWEREWRLNKNLDFETYEVSFLIIPESHHEAAKIFFKDAEHHHTGPSYKCPFIDISWTLQKIKDTLADD
tara:strand:- start:137535 stop:138191 length:657 start_codon:yes stop_codon:yes gene_type:complete